MGPKIQIKFLTIHIQFQNRSRSISFLNSRLLQRKYYQYESNKNCWDSHSSEWYVFFELDKDYKNEALKNDGSASSLTSNNNKSRGKKQKVKITEAINLKKSHTKMNSNKPVINQRECLNIFENENQDFNTKITEQSSLFKVSDASMDLRNSFD